MTLLDARQLTKSYGGVRVLDAVDFTLNQGEIRALAGENGAGKSTFIKIVSGAVVPDAGDVRLAGQAITPGDPSAARHSGISVVYQEFTLVPELSVTENVMLGREPAGLLLPRRQMERRVAAILAELGADIHARAPVRTLNVARQQIVEIARALLDEAKVLILDEPTATLSSAEVDSLFVVLRKLRANGLGIIYVSHRLDEIFTLADAITVFRDGRHVATQPTSELTPAALIRLMVGRDVAEEFPARDSSPGAVVIEVERLAAPPRFSELSLTVREGEIVGLAGLVGSGRTSAALALAGAIPATGSVKVAGRSVRFRSPFDAIQSGLAYVTEDRKALGMFRLMGTDENITVTHLARFARAWVLSLAACRQAARNAVRDFDIRASRLDQPAGTLSGGNQQKALVARFLIAPPRLLILDEPTRGVDVGARSEIYRIMNRLTDRGLAILMISSDLPELLGMSDRIVVMREGRVTGTLSRAAATPERVLAMAAVPS